MPPPTAKALLDQGEKQVRVGDLGGALSTYSKFLKANPRHPSAAKVRLRRGQLQMMLGRYDEAAEGFERALARDESSTELLHNLAQAHALAGRLDAAVAAARRSIEVDPDFAQGVGRAATFLQYAGRLDEAAEIIKDADDRGVRHWSIEMAFSGLAARTGRSDESIERLARMAEDPDQAPQAAAALTFTLAYMLDRAERYDDAWETVTRANAMLGLTHDPDSFDKAVARELADCSPDSLRAMPTGSDTGQDAVFVLGAPRSGTTLVEQIIAAHPDAESAGEMDAARNAVSAVVTSPGARSGDLSRLRPVDVIKASNQYLAELRLRTGDARRRVDKTPSNWRHLGILSRLVPDARVIVCQRDLRDIAVSTYFRHFSSGHEYSTRLDWIGRYLATCERTIAHWERELAEVAPGFVIERVRYEDLVAAPEHGAEHIIELAGLGWDDACLTFKSRKRVAPTLSTDQVGRGVYTGSRARWRHYEKHLDPLLDAMGDLAPDD